MATYVTHSPKVAAATATLIELAGVEKVYRTGKLEYPILALLVIQMPLRRAVRFKPGEALRYA